jgi:phage virion morphogenesis protein
MAGLGLRADIQRDAALRSIGALAARIDDPERALTFAGVHMLDSITRNFDEAGRPERWAPNAPATITRKGSSQPLIHHGDLKLSIRYATTATQLILSGDGPGARIHQFGGQAGRGRSVTIPARPYMLFQEEDLLDIAGLYEDYIASGGGR